MLHNNSAPAALSGESASKVNWITIQQLNELAQEGKIQKQKKKIFIDLYTDWCGWCKRMDQNTFGDATISNYLNKHYHSVKFNAESKDEITFGNQTFKWIPSGRNGINELGQSLGVVNGRIGYPTIVFLDEDLRKIQAIPGYKDPAGMLPMLVYYAEDHYKKTAWNEFQASFDPAKYQ